MDFRRLPGFTTKGEDSLERPYFDMFMNMFVTADFPTVTEPPVWRWICGDKEMELKATQLAGKVMFTANYVKKYATYEPAKFERLEDLPATNKSAPCSGLSPIPDQKVGEVKVQHPCHLPSAGYSCIHEA